MAARRSQKMRPSRKVVIVVTRVHELLVRDAVFAEGLVVVVIIIVVVFFVCRTMPNF
jgi:hypothetical protein